MTTQGVKKKERSPIQLFEEIYKALEKEKRNVFAKDEAIGDGDRQRFFNDAIQHLRSVEYSEESVEYEKRKIEYTELWASIQINGDYAKAY